MPVGVQVAAKPVPEDFSTNFQREIIIYIIQNFTRNKDGIKTQVKLLFL